MVKLITRSASLVTLLLLIGCAGCPERYFNCAYYGEEPSGSSTSSAAAPITCKTEIPASASSSPPASPSSSASEGATKVTNVVVSITGNDIDVKTTPAAAASTDQPPRSPQPSSPCPDPPQSVSSTSSTPSFRPCEASVIKAAIDYCVSNVLKQDGIVSKAQIIGGVTAIVFSAIAGGIASAAGAGTKTSIGIGAAVGLLSTADSSALKLLPSSPSVTIGSMITAAQQYLIAAQLSYNTTPQLLKEYYYRDLFNAVGAACPASAFSPLKSRFDKQNIPTTK